MPAILKILTACVLSLALAACSGRTVFAPVQERSNGKPPPADSSVTINPIKIVRKIRANADVYVVKKGDTLSSIARQHGMSYKQLAKINAIRLPYKIYAGQKLKLKGDARAAVVKAPVSEPGKPKQEKPVTKVVEKKAKLPAPAVAVPEFDGKWQWPTRGRLLRGFKPKEPGKKGIFIGGHNGQPVKAAASGKVVYVGSGLVGYGKLIIIRHNKDLLSTYGHNSNLLVAEGEYVKAGQMIAKMGNSSTGRTELYFEIRKEGKPVDPAGYLPRKD